MAHRSRGTISHTYDIKQVIDVDFDRLSITYTDAAHAEPRMVILKVDPVTPAAQQLLLAMADSIAVYGDGQWESAYALAQVASRVTSLIRLGLLHDPVTGWVCSQAA